MQKCNLDIYIYVICILLHVLYEKNIMLKQMCMYIYTNFIYPLVSTCFQAKSAFLHICFDFLSPPWNPKLELRIQEFPRRESSSILTNRVCVAGS